MKSTNNVSLKFICKSIQLFISLWQIYRLLCCKKDQQRVLPSSSSKDLYSWKWKLNYLIAFYFGNTLYNYLHDLLRKMISYRKQMWQVGSVSNIIIWLLLLEFGLHKVPILSLWLLRCLLLQNLLRKLISAHISIHPNPICFYIHPKLKTLLLESFL